MGGSGMKIALISGSPKTKHCTSLVLLDGLRGCLRPDIEVIEAAFRTASPGKGELAAVLGCDALVVACPLYVDGLPGHLVGALEALEAELKAAPGRSRTLYGILNCGFYEGEQAEVALEMLGHWARRAGVRWGGGIGVGAGGMLGGLDSVPMGKGPKKSIGAALADLAGRIGVLAEGEPVYVHADIPRIAYKTAAEHGWRTAVKKRGLGVKDLFTQR